MKKIALSTLILAFMTTSVFADFTIKDLFVEGGTSKPVKEKNNKKHDCQ
jgi:hypothetical protein